MPKWKERKTKMLIDKFKKGVIAATAAAVALMTGGLISNADAQASTPQAKSTDGNIIFADFDEMTEAERSHTILTRGDKLLISKETGICLNDKGDGALLNVDGYCDYIHYTGYSAGDIITTYFVWDNTDSPDGMELRYDFQTGYKPVEHFWGNYRTGGSFESLGVEYTIPQGKCGNNSGEYEDGTMLEAWFVDGEILTVKEAEEK